MRYEVSETDDIIGVEFVCKEEVNVHIIQKLDARKWKKRVIKMAVDEHNTNNNLVSEWDMIREKMTSRPRRLLVLISSLSGSQNGQSVYQRIVAPLFELAKITTDVIVTERHNHILDIMSTYCLDNLDGVVVLGGDGAYNQCANGLLERIQKDANNEYNDPNVKFKPSSIPVGHIPTGSLNLLAKYCYGCIDAETAALAIIKGKSYHIDITNLYSDKKWIRGAMTGIYHGNVMEFSVYSDKKWIRGAMTGIYHGNIMEFSVYSDKKWIRGAMTGIYHGNVMEFSVYVENFRWLKTTRYAVMLPYYIFTKTLPRIDVALKLLYSNTCGIEDVEQAKPTEETIQGTFLDIMTTRENLYRSDTFLGSPACTSGCTFLNLYTTDCSRWQILKHYMRTLNNADNHVYPYFVQQKKIIGYKIKINNSNINHADEEGRHLYHLGVDGETIDLQTPQWEIRYQESVFKVFTTLL